MYYVYNRMMIMLKQKKYIEDKEWKKNKNKKYINNDNKFILFQKPQPKYIKMWSGPSNISLWQPSDVVNTVAWGEILQLNASRRSALLPQGKL